MTDNDDVKRDAATLGHALIRWIVRCAMLAATILAVLVLLHFALQLLGWSWLGLEVHLGAR